MSATPPFDPEDAYDGLAGPYDGAPVAEEDLWFLPAPLEDEALDPIAPPRRPAMPVVKAQSAWRQAEADLARPLADLAMRFGALDQRLRMGPDGWHNRLALLEVAELSWQTGTRLSSERLALWCSLRLSGVQDNSGELLRLGWAVRRLSRGPGPEISGALAADELAGFLGRQAPDPSGAFGDTDPLRASDDVLGRMQDWVDGLAGSEDLHGITRACMGLYLWPLADVSGRDGSLTGDGETSAVEAAVVAARWAAQTCVSGTGGALFLPIVLGGAGAMCTGGSAYDRLSRWLKGADQACLAALLHLDRLQAWHAKAQESLVGCSGRTPGQLLEMLLAWPLVSVPMAVAQTGASRPAVQRNLNLMRDRGLLREVTGQSRYRFWAIQF